MAATLNHILNMGSESLHNSRVGVDVTGHNIANAQTPGFSRQRVNLEARHPVQYGNHVLGQGAKIQTVDRLHDKFIEAQWRKEIQLQGANQGEHDGLGRLEALFSPEMSATMRDRVTTFYNSVREFANYPDEQAVRTSLIESGSALAQSINATHSGIAQIQEDVSNEISNSVALINQKLGEVATLNQSIKELEAAHTSRANDLHDRRDAAVRVLSGLIDTQAYKDENDQITLRGPGGSLLVEGPRAAAFEMDHDLDRGPHQRIILRDAFGQSTRDVTGEITQGRLAGLVKVRDVHGRGLRDNVNLMASSLAESFNGIHRQGYGLGAYADMKGRDFFEGLGEGEPAHTLRVSVLIQNEPDAIGAAMTPRAGGDNVIGNALLKTFYEPVVAGRGMSISQHYDDFVGRLGMDAMHAREASKASDIVVAQIEAQREAVSGVSLDEEAAALLKYQHLFTASSRIITTADEMFRTVLDLKR
jgi:flagellar hook-associated protein 1 FlgK